MGWKDEILLFCQSGSAYTVDSAGRWIILKFPITPTRSPSPSSRAAGVTEGSDDGLSSLNRPYNVLTMNNLLEHEDGITADARLLLSYLQIFIGEASGPIKDTCI